MRTHSDEVMQKIASIFFSDWYTKTEAAKEYTNLGKNSVGHGSVRFYFKDFNSKKWFDKGMIPKPRGNRGYSTWERFRLRPEVYFEVRKFKMNVDRQKKARQEFKFFMCEFLRHPSVRKYIAAIKPIKLFDFFDQILLYLVVHDSLSMLNLHPTNKDPASKSLKKAMNYVPDYNAILKGSLENDLKKKVLNETLPVPFEIYLKTHALLLYKRKDYSQFVSFMAELSEPLRTAKSLQIV